MGITSKPRWSTGYDNLYRLVHEHRTPLNPGDDPGVAYEYNFAYDAAGNRTAWQEVGGVTTYYHHDAANKLQNYGSSDSSPYTGNTFLEYDIKGNTRTETLGGIVTEYTWDPLNRMIQWEKTGRRNGRSSLCNGAQFSSFWAI